MMILIVSLLNIQRKINVSEIIANKYVPTYQEDYYKLHWYERDMMYYIDYLRYKNMRDDPGSYF